VPEAAIICPKCHVPVPAEGDQMAEERCPACRAVLSIETFPRLRAGNAGLLANGGKHAAEGEAVCHFFPELQAETICDECGCFLSLKAAVDWNGRNVCLPCLHQLRESKADDDFLAKRTIYDNVALGLVTWLAPVSLITAPLALYYLLRYRKAPRGIVPRGSFRWWLAFVLSVGLLGGWIFLFVIWIAMFVRAMGS
jgi:uncharacterized paraquat-inducible protein A